MSRRVVLAPDAFKGSLSSVGVASALARGFRQAWPEAELIERPLADGGEGTLLALARAEPGAERTRSVIGPQGEPLKAGWWHADAGPAVVEMARASGLSVTRHRRPLTATTYGAGQLVEAALAATDGPIWITCGGSATVDGGAGLLRALGFELLDAAGRPVAHGGADLVRLERIVPPSEGPLAGCSADAPSRLVVLYDVQNPLVGPEGAAPIYGPQKGATPAMVKQLAAGLERFGAVCARTFDRDPRHLPGAGAAGGLPAGLWAAAGAELVPGFDALADRIGLDTALDGADLVVTAEGRVDDQTAQGKTIAGVLRRARQRDLPVWAFAGQITEEAEAWCPAGLSLIPIADGPLTLGESIARAGRLLSRAAARAAGLADSVPGTR